MLLGDNTGPLRGCIVAADIFTIYQCVSVCISTYVVDMCVLNRGLRKMRHAPDPVERGCANRGVSVMRYTDTAFLSNLNKT